MSLFSVLLISASALCPFSSKAPELPYGHNARTAVRVAPDGFYEAFDAMDWNAVKADLRTLFTDSQEFWPADYGNYAPFFVRLAWHNSGSYRASDGRGGPDGGRQRFDPERSWDDNTNLDKARKLLEPIKEKYGLGLSWGDLIILAGDTAIESMNGPVLGTCLGRIDDVDGFWSDRLGPTPDQEENSPCLVPGACDTPFGTNVRGLIYVNPEGFHGNPVPELSAPQVRSTFGRMSMNDTETVALIGGGHAFGKTHGACPSGPGLPPNEDPLHSWVGTCGGNGKGVNAFTSGFEGPWTVTPTFWDNSYFRNLVNYDWEKWVGPGGHYQWRVKGQESPFTVLANNTGTQDIMMLTSDISLMHDPEGIYQPIVKKFAEDQKYLGEQFAAAWYKLTTRDMGPITRCLGPLTAPVQEFQGPLPAANAKLADFDQVRSRIKAALTTDQPDILPLVDGSYGPQFVRLAWRCAGTFRVTDYQGGCNGARIRVSPQKDWPVNKGLDKVLALLDNIKKEFGTGLSWSDLIVLAGTVALEQAGAPAMDFCGGRVDVSTSIPDPVSINLEYMNREFYVEGRMNASIDDLEQYTLLLGLDRREFTAIMGARALGKIPLMMGQRTHTPTHLSSGYFKNLVSEDWTPTGDSYMGSNGLTILRDDILLIAAAPYKAVVQEFAGDEEAYLKTLASAWTKMMNSDRFDGPTGNVCSKSSVGEIVSTQATAQTNVWLLRAVIILSAALGVLLIGMMCFAIRLRSNRKQKNADLRKPLFTSQEA